MTRAKRMPRNPRRRVLYVLAEMGKVRLGQVKLWAQPQNRDGRPLAAAEKWENRPASWVGLLQDLDRIQRHIEALRRIAQYQLGWMRQLRETSNHVPQQRQVIRR